MAMNLPWRSIDLMRRPTRALVVAWGEPRRMRNWRNSALRMRRPTMAGRRVRTTVSTSGSSGMLFGQVYTGQVHQNIPCFDANRIGGYPQRVVEHAGASRGIEWPRVPGAAHDGPFECSLPERSAVVRADAVDRANVAGHVAESVEVIAIHDFEERALGQFVEARQFLVSHCGLSFQCTAERSLLALRYAGRGITMLPSLITNPIFSDRLRRKERLLRFAPFVFAIALSTPIANGQTTEAKQTLSRLIKALQARDYAVILSTYE